ncbi:FtsK/SpoIIIE domain-containing protein [Galbitalea sp. SE-J8]|uniref:FtsK/SpoIIIE domain-containing protein n=1 Tax=Galbitalea sp. SE-J8 TaxID=3054952 RepID=UPI00259CEE3A|nr:FtsK/SpoIIIE domain-containing protein [Galbitalea sp. SE-J8]MDM4762672.1 FtsK/SpoIIIE domain-containing protein [Galbitalea sp. SE-J8]
MRFTFTLENSQTRRAGNIHVDADPSIPTGEVVELAQRRLGVDAEDPGGPLTMYIGAGPLDPRVALRDSGIRDGTVVTMAHAGYAPPPLRADSIAELRVLSGPGAGRILRCGAGVVAIGAHPSMQLVVDGVDASGAAVPDVALLATVGADGTVWLQPVNEYRGAALDGEPVASAVQWNDGAQLEVGGVLLGLARFADNGAHLVVGDDPSVFEYNRPPRLLPPERTATFTLPSPPAEPQGRGLNLLAALTPIAAAGVSAIAFQNYAFLLIAALSPVIMIVQQLQQKRSGRKTYRQQVDEYWELRRRIEADAQQALAVEREEWLASAPDPALVYEIATTPLPLLWARRRADPDHLTLRVGTATQPSRVTLDDPEELAHKRTVVWDARDVPAIVSLVERGVVGIAGPDAVARPIAKWALAQLGVLQSPKDVRFYLLTESRRGADWEWLGWLPHAAGEHPGSSMTNIGTTTTSTARCVAELIAIIEARASTRSSGRERIRSTPDDIVVVMDGARRLRAMPSLVRILREGPEVGVYSICVDADERLLPEECGAVVIADGDGVLIRQQRVSLVDRIRPDIVGDDWLEWIGRSLGPIRDASPDVTDGAIPTSSRLLSVLALDPPTPEAVQARWLVGGRSTRAVLGESIDGEFSLDLRLDGPHGLVAGTTGSGKSELLQTLVASLAVANTPTEMNFVLVDYKGGAAFKDCVDLPHTVGMVTDLDAHQVERALDSLGAELRTREHVFAGAGAKDLEDYQDLQAKRPELASLPRLLIVIDEFASMARELPDFVRGLVGIAQRGRSLGIHLILATQRPGGVVSPEIRANTNLRIALRMTDASESTDVIDSPESASISKATPGRAYVRLGAASLMPFQAGRVGGRFPGAQTVVGVADPLVEDLGFADWSEPVPVPKAATGDAGDVEITDLTVLVDSVRRATDALGIPAPRRPWLPPLGDVVSLDALPAVPSGRSVGVVIPVGLEDHPALQRQVTTALDLDELGHLFVIGSARSGRSQALRTIAGSGASAAAVGDLHLYAIDCGTGALLPLSALPHCGVVVQRHEPERVGRLLQGLVDEVAHRQSAFSASGVASLTEQRAGTPEARLPHVVVLIDQWEGFVNVLADIDNGALVDRVAFLLREGATVGVHLVVSGDRTLFSSRMSSLVDRKILLNLADRGEYSNEGIRARDLPDEIGPGRGFWNQSGTELQFAVLPGENSGQGQARALREIGAAARTAHGSARGPRPFRIDPLPASVTLADALALVPEESRGPSVALVGVGGDELTGLVADLSGDQNGFVIAGPARSGRSTLLATMGRSLIAHGTRLVIIAPRPSVVRDLGGEPGVLAVVTDAAIGEDELRALVPASDEHVVVLVDDAELLRESPAEAVFRDILSTGREHGQGVVVAGALDEVASGFRGWQLELKKSRRGVLLDPQSVSDGELIGAKLHRGLVGRGTRPGLGLHHGADLTLREIRLPSAD